MAAFAPLASGDPEQVGRYRLAGRLGQGGTGRVYLARSPSGRTVAVKVVRTVLVEVLPYAFAGAPADARLWSPRRGRCRHFLSVRRDHRPLLVPGPPAAVADGLLARAPTDQVRPAVHGQAASRPASMRPTIRNAASVRPPKVCRWGPVGAWAGRYPARFHV